MAAAAEDLLCASDLHIDKNVLLGKGGYGDVYRGEHDTLGLVAVKIFIGHGQLPERNKRALVKEVKKLKEAQGHSHILKMHGYLMEPDNYGLVLEYMHFGSVTNFIKEYKVDVALLVRIVHQMISAMTYLHELDPPFLHLDMKADNILIDNYINAKLSDFGLAEWKNTTMTMTRGLAETTGRAGTITHIGPEVLQNINTPQSPQLDVYAFGITIWEIFSGKTPYGNQSTALIKQAVISNQRPDLMLLQTNCPMFIRGMMIRCWNALPLRRPSFTELSKETHGHYVAYENRVPAALKSVRSQICEEFSLNDEEYIGTAHLDELEVPEEEAMDDTDAAAADSDASTPVVEAADAASADPLPVLDTPAGLGIVDQAPPSEPEPVQVNPELKNPLKLNRRIVPKFRTTEDVSMNDKQIRKAIRSPPAIELSNTRFCQCLVPHRDGQEVVKDHDKLREYMEQDTDLLREMMQGNGQFFSYLNTPNFPDSVHRGKVAQFEKHLINEFTQPSQYTSRGVYKREEGEHYRTQRHDSMRCSKYGEKMFRNGLGHKLMKALKEPRVLSEYINEGQTSGEGEKFQILDPAVVEAAKDPVLVSILLVQDPITLDNLMRYYPDMFMKLLSENKTSYREERDEPRRNRGDDIMRGFPDMGRFGRGFEDDDLGMYGMPNMKMMMGPSEMRKQKEMMRKSMERSWGHERDRDRKRPDEKSMKEIERIIRDTQNQQLQKFKSKNENNSSSMSDTVTDKKKIEHAVPPPVVRPELPSGLTNEGQSRGGILSNLAGIFTGAKKSIFDTNQMRESIPSVDMHSVSPPGSTTTPQPAESGTNQPGTQPLSTGPASLPAGSLKVVPPRTAGHPPMPTPVKQEKKESPSKPSPPPSLAIGKRDTEHDAAPATPIKTPSSAKPTGGASGIQIQHKHSSGATTKVKMSGANSNAALQIGDNNVMVVKDKKPKSKVKSKMEGLLKRKSTSDVKLTNSENLLNAEQIDMIATNIGSSRKRLCREMGLADGEIEQIEQDFHINGSYEQMYQALSRWNQRNGRAATVKKMAKFLLNVDRVDLAKQLK